jgi:hypothetical protein
MRLQRGASTTTLAHIFNDFESAKVGPLVPVFIELTYLIIFSNSLKAILKPF